MRSETSNGLFQHFARFRHDIEFTIRL